MKSIHHSLILVFAAFLSFLNPVEVSPAPTTEEIERVVHDWKMEEALAFLDKCPLDLIQSNGERLMKLAVLRYIPSRIGEFMEESTWETRLLKPLIEKFGLKLTENHLETALYAGSDKQLFADMLDNGAPMSPSFMEHSFWRGNLAVTCAKHTGLVDYKDPKSGKTLLMALCGSQWHQKYAFELLELGADPCIETADGSVAAEFVIPRYGVFNRDADSEPNIELLIALVQYGFKFECIRPEKYCYYGKELELIAALPNLLEEAKGAIDHENPTKEEIRKKTLEIISSD